MSSLPIPRIDLRSSYEDTISAFSEHLTNLGKTVRESSAPGSVFRTATQGPRRARRSEQDKIVLLHLGYGSDECSIQRTGSLTARERSSKGFGSMLPTARTTLPSVSRSHCTVRQSHRALSSSGIIRKCPDLELGFSRF